MAKPVFSFYSLDQAEITRTGPLTSIEMDFRHNGHNQAPLFVIRGTETLTITPSTALATGWLRFHYDFESQDAGRYPVILYGNSTPLLRLTTPNTVTDDLQFEYYNGAGWTALGAVFNHDSSGGTYDKPIDIEWDIHDTTGAFRIYLSGALHAEFTGDTLVTAETQITKIEFQNADSSINYDSHFWNLFIDSVDTRGLYWSTEQATAGGTYFSFAGTGVNDVNEDPFSVGCKADFITATDNAQKATFNYEGVVITLSQTGVPELVVLGGQITAQSEPGLYLKGITRKTSTDYDLGAWIQPYSDRDWFYGVELENDPSTGSPWADLTAVGAHEMGWESSTTEPV